jgi:hypothetical protein
MISADKTMISADNTMLSADCTLSANSIMLSADNTLISADIIVLSTDITVNSSHLMYVSSNCLSLHTILWHCSYKEIPCYEQCEDRAADVRKCVNINFLQHFYEFLCGDIFELAVAITAVIKFGMGDSTEIWCAYKPCLQHRNLSHIKLGKHFVAEP